MKTHATIEIDRPIDEVFVFTTTCVVQWSTIVVEDEVVEQKDEGVGTIFRVVTEERGRRMAFDGVVTHHRPPNLHAVSMTGRQFDLEVHYLFEDLGGRTRVTQDTTVLGKGLIKLMFGMLGWLMVKSGCTAAQKELTHLKRRMEDEKPSSGSASSA